MSIPELNSKMRQIDLIWGTEAQRLEDNYRTRAINMSKRETISILSKTFNELDMMIQSQSLNRGYVEAVATAPKPLTNEEWEEVRKVENPRLREIVGGLAFLPAKPDKYFITITARVVGNESISVIRLDYHLRNPEYEAMGIRPSQKAPPEAIKIGSSKIWSIFNEKVSDRNTQLRKRREADPLVI